MQVSFLFNISYILHVLIKNVCDTATSKRLTKTYCGDSISVNEFLGHLNENRALRQYFFWEICLQMKRKWLYFGKERWPCVDQMYKFCEYDCIYISCFL